MIRSVDQAGVYELLDVRAVVDNVLKGVNGSVIAYGQTGSGKTYTIEGDDVDFGIAPRAIAQVADIC